MAASVVLTLLVLATAYRMEAGVFELTSANIETWHEEYLESLRMVQIYAPFLMKSKEFSPVYISVAKAVKDDPEKIALGKVDMAKEENKPLIEKYKAGDLPSLVFFRAGSKEPLPYRGAFTQEDIVAFLRKHVFKVLTLTEVEEYERISGEENPVHGMLLAVVESKDSELAQMFLQYAKQNSGKFVYGLVEDKGEFAGRFDLNSEAVIVSRPTALLGKDDMAFRNITKAVSFKHFTKQIERFYPTAISLWTHHTEDLLLARGLPIVTLYFDLDWKHNLPRVKYLANRFRRAVEKYFSYNEDDNKVSATQFLFALADRQEYIKELERLQLNTNRVFLSLKDKEGRHYVLKETKIMVDDQKIKQEAISRFIDNYLSGKVSQYIRSEDIPEEDFDRNVRVVVGENFQSAIMEAKTSVLLLVYSSFHTGSATQDASIHETFSKVGEVFRDSEEVLIAKVEGTLNEIFPNFQSHTYPKIYFLPVQKKYEPSVFGGSVTVEELVKFAKEEVEKVKQDTQKSTEEKKDL